METRDEDVEVIQDLRCSKEGSGSTSDLNYLWLRMGTSSFSKYFKISVYDLEGRLDSNHTINYTKYLSTTV